MRSLLGKHPWLTSLLGVHAALFMADPCGGGDSGSGPSPAPSDAASVDAGTPAPTTSPWSVYQKRGPGEPVVDPAAAGGEYVDSAICNDNYGDALLGTGWKISDPGVDIRTISASTAPGEGVNASVLYVASSVAGAHPFRAFSTCLHQDKGKALIDVGITTTAQLPGVSPTGKSATAVSSCQAGTLLVGGGLNVEAPSDGLKRVYPRVTKLGPQDNAWVIRARSIVGTSSFSTTAICAQSKTEVLFPYPTKTFAVGAGATAQDTLGCPEGYSVYSGGFAMDDDAKVTVLDNRPAPDLATGVNSGAVTGWLIAAKSDDTIPRNVKITVICGKTSVSAPKAPVFTPPSPESPAPDPKIAVTPNPVSAYCANGQWPNKLTVKNDGGGNLSWTVAQPTDTPNLLISPMNGLVAAGATQTVTLSGQVANMTSFVLPFAGNGGTADVTVQCQ